MSRPHSISAAVLGMLVLAAPGGAKAGLVLTADAAGVQTSQVAGVTTETFNAIAAGKCTTLTTAVGTVTSNGAAVVKADQYGGGTGNYFAIGAESGGTIATLTFGGPESYFGMLWSAADALNSMELLSDGVVVATFNPATALGSLGPAYFGNPNNTSEDPGEKFAYLNFIGTNGTTFNQVVFNNSSTGTGFESDNWSIDAAATNGTGGGTPIGGVTVVPAPPTIAITSLGLICVCSFGLYRRRRAGGARFAC